MVRGEGARKVKWRVVEERRQMSLYASNCDEQILVLVCMMLKSLHGLWQAY